MILESDSRISLSHPHLFQGLEWGFTLLFGLEYVLRLLCTSQPLRYATSFFGVVDLIAILPSFLGLMLAGSKYFLVVRILRLLRVFRILKLGEYLQESELLWRAIVASRRKIIVFLMTMVVLVVVIGALMYLIEGESGGFVSIPVGIYWAVVTVTTVGYGDVAPVTPLGRFVASIVMLLGYSIIAVPTGILTVGIQQARRRQETGALPQLRQGRAPGRCPLLPPVRQRALRAAHPPGSGGLSPGQQPLDRQIRQRLPRQPFHLPHAGGAGHVDLAEAAIDHIDPHEEQTLRPQHRGQFGADPPLRLVSSVTSGAPPTARLLRNSPEGLAVHGPERLAVHQQDALVAGRHPRQEGLHHHRQRSCWCHQLQQGLESGGEAALRTTP